MNDITSTIYWTEVSELATSIAEMGLESASNDKDGALEVIQDRILHETIDGHQWVIYCAYNLDVLKFSDNEDYMSDNFGGDELKAAIEAGGLSGLHTSLAFWALYADVSEKIDDALDELLDDQD